MFLFHSPSLDINKRLFLLGLILLWLFLLWLWLRLNLNWLLSRLWLHLLLWLLWLRLCLWLLIKVDDTNYLKFTVQFFFTGSASHAWS